MNTPPPTGSPHSNTREIRPPRSLVPASTETAEIKALIGATVQAAVEVLAGTRPIHQLARRLDTKPLISLQHRAALIRLAAARSSDPLLSHLHRQCHVRAIRICAITPDIYEGSAVVVDELRARAVAVRLERSRTTWRITELMFC